MKTTKRTKKPRPASCSDLVVKGMRMMVNLGWSSHERRVSQPVEVDFVLRFESPPIACETDELEGTVCYGQCVELIRSHCESRSFRLLESLARQIYALLAAKTREQLVRKAKIQVRVTKLNPPVPGIHGGVSFGLGDWP